MTRMCKACDDIEKLQDEVNTLRAWLEWLTVVGAGFVIISLIVFALWSEYGR